MNTNISFKERGKLLAAVAILAMVVCVFAVAMPSDAVDGTVTPDGETATITEAGDFTTVLGADATYTKIVLGADIEADVTIPEGKVIELDLNGYTLTNVKSHTITVNAGATLTITDSSDATGTVDNITHAKAALYNEGIVILNGGNFTRSLENGSSATESGGNSYYNIVNHGTMTINNGVKITQDGHFSSMIMNGWNTSNTEVAVNDVQMTITGGDFTGGLNTVKNFGLSTLTISGGTFINTTQAAILNLDHAHISGGVFESTGPAILNAIGTDTYECGILGISGGDYSYGEGHAAIEMMLNGSPSFGKITVTGGTFDNNDIFRIPSFASTYSSTDIYGSVDFYGNSVTINGLDQVSKGITFGIGSIVISGTIDVTSPVTITASGEVSISGEIVGGGTTEEGNLTITQTEEGSTITLENLTVAEGASLSIETDVIVGNNVINNGSVKISSEAEVSGEEIVNNGAVIGDDDVYHVSTYDGLIQAIKNKGVTVVLDADITATNYITSSASDGVTVDLNGNNLDMGNYAINLIGITLVIPSGSEFSTNARVSHVNNMETVAGSKIVLGNDCILYSDQESNEVPCPILAEGANVNIGGVNYTVYEVSISGGSGTIQYGIGVNNLYYTGNAYDLTSITRNNLNVVPLTTGYTYNTLNATLVYDGEIINAGTYENALLVSLNLTGTDAGRPTFAAQHLDVVVLPVNPSVSVSVDNWSFGGTPSTPVPTYVDMDGDTIPNGGYDAGGITYDIISSETTIYSGLSSLEGLSQLPVGDYTLVANFPAKDANFLASKATSEFEVTEAQLELEFGTVENTEGLFWGTDPDRYMNYDDYEVELIDGTVIIDGGIYYIADINVGASQTIYGDDQDSGFYVLLNITNPYAFDVTVNFGGNNNNTITGTNSDDNTLQLMLYLGTTLEDVSKNMTVTPDSEDFQTRSYNLDLSGLYRMTASGYDAVAVDAQAQMAAQGITRSDVADMTMWMTYDGKEMSGLKGTLYYEGQPIYSETFGDPTGGNSNRVWYFSFDTINGSYIGLEAVNTEYYDNFQTYVSTYGNAAPGAYTMTITSGDDVVATANAYIEGEVDSGFAYFADDAVEGIKTGNAGFSGTDVIGKTLWFTWYQSSTYDVTISLTKDDYLYTENATLGEGLRTFYASFDDQLGEFTNPIGTYTVKVTSGGIIIAEGKINVQAQDSDVTIMESVQDPVLGMALDSIQNIMKIETTSVNGTFNVGITGELVYITAGAYPGFQADSMAGYYLALNANNANFDWSAYENIVVKLGNKEFTSVNVESGEWDGTFVLYLGNNIDELKIFNLSVDFDGDGAFFTESTYSIDANGMTAFEYRVQIVDEYNDTLEYALGGGEYLTLPNGSNYEAGFQYWIDENGKNRNAGSVVIITPVLDADGNGIIEFRSFYGIDDAPTVSIDMPVSFVTGQEYVFSVSTTAGDMAGVMVNGTGTFTASADSYTVWYLEVNDGLWYQLTGDLFGPAGGFLLSNATSYFKVVFSEAGNYDLSIQIVGSDGTVVCEDSSKVIVLDASDLPEYDTREPRQGEDYYVISEVLDGKLHFYVATDKWDAEVYRNALDRVWFQISTDSDDSNEYVVLSDSIRMYDEDTLIVGEIVIDIPNWVLYSAQIHFADNVWIPIGGAFVSGFSVSEIVLDPTEINMIAGETETIAATVLPDTAIDKTVVWSTSDPEVATVDENGSIIAVGFGTATITATVGDVNATCTVNVKELAGIEVTSPEKTLYYAGEELDTAGMIITAYYTDDTSFTVTEDYTVAPTDMDVPGTVTVTVSYEGFEDTFNVTVGGLQSISIQVPDKTVYNVGEELDTAGMEVLANYTNSLPQKDVTSEVTVEPTMFDAPGTIDVTITYEDASGFVATGTFQVTVNAIA